MIRNQFITDQFALYHGDCVEVAPLLPDESIGLSIFSPPFAELYTYSDEVADMGNSKDYNEFLFAFSFIVKELYRVMMQGRNVCVHCMDLPIQKGKEGYIGLRDFSNMIREAFEKEGFIYHSRITIWKDPVVEMQRTKALGLLHKQVKKDSTMSRVGLPDYVLVFRKDGERNNPVNCKISVNEWQEIASPVWNFDDLDRDFNMIIPLLSKEAYLSLPSNIRQKYASPVWDDINYSNTLNLKGSRDEKDEKHICPLQLDTIDRLLTLYSNEGDTVFTPFLGIGSEVYQSIIRNRKGVGIELKESYFNAAIRNCNSAIEAKKQMSIFQ